MFQDGVSAHARLLLWLHNAPQEKLGPNTPETVKTAKHLVSVDLSLVPRLRFQVHEHTHTCFKNAMPLQRAVLVH